MIHTEPRFTGVAQKEHPSVNLDTELPLESGRAGILRSCLRNGTSNEHSACLGPVRVVSGLKSSIGSVLSFPDTRVQYPQKVIEALSDILAEYNRAFKPLVNANMEARTDYQFARDRENRPLNFFVQVDMVGLSPEFLRVAAGATRSELASVLRHGIFEIENSLAMYQLLEQTFSSAGNASMFQVGFRNSLDEIRQRFGRPIALLAVTEEKLRGMRGMEFGKADGEALSDAEVRELSGFDMLMGPKEFREHLAQNGGECRCLLYVRSSEPIEKLKSPSLTIHHPLLSDNDLRRVIKANALTFNVDRPGMPPGQCINDTKAYMPELGMGFVINELEDMLDVAALETNRAGPSEGLLTAAFSKYLGSHEIDAGQILRGEISLRAKPLQGTYGCYGHVRGKLTERKFLSEVSQNIRQRGAYIIQPEMVTPTVVNTSNETMYTYIDRNFLSLTGNEVRFLGGFRSMLPVESTEAKRGRIHGSKETVYVEIF